MPDVFGEPEPEKAPAQQRLAPLPSRVSSTAEQSGAPTLSKPPQQYVEELLERAFVLLSTLNKDVRDVHEDEEELRLRIELEQSKRKEQALEAKEQVEDFLRRAYRIAQSKSKVPILEQGLIHAKVIDDETITYDDVLSELELELKAARGITGAIRLGRIGELLQQANAIVKRMQADAEGLADRQIDYVRKERETETKEAAASFDIGTTILNRDLDILEANLPLAARRWTDGDWETWSPPSTTSELIRIGSYHDDLLHADIPMLVGFPLEQSLVIESSGQRDAAIKGIQSILVRMVAALPPGAVRFTFVDPKGLGESVAPLLPLGEFDPELIDKAVATTPEEIEDRLIELTHHVERVITQYLRGTYESLAHCNDAAGEILEPYHVLVVLDHPSHLDETTSRLLAAIADNGPRCGVFTIITKDEQPTYTAYKTPLPEQARLLKLEHGEYRIAVPNAGTWGMRFDAPPRPNGDGPALVERIVTTAGRLAGAARESALELGKLYDVMNRVSAQLPGSPGLPDLEEAVDLGDPTTWWSASSADGIAVPLGRLGATSLAAFAVDAKRPSMLVAGQSGSGVSNVVHAIITGLSMLYSPAELELYLLGFRGGRELAVYGEQALPHAKVVATEADRDFGMSMLKELDEELERRLALLRDTVGERAGYEGYRDDPTVDEHLPRILVVIDNFAGMFVPEDRTAQRGRELLDQLARLGPTAGIHLLLVTADDDKAISAPIVQSVRQRLLLALPEDHARHLLGDAASEVANLARAGDAVLCTNPGDALTAKRFQTVLVNPTEQAICLRDLQRLMEERGQGQAPQVYDGAAVARLERRDPVRLVGDGSKQGARRMPRLWLGEPMGIGMPVEALLRRQDGANLLVVAPDSEVGQGLLLSSIVSSLLVHGDNVGVLALDFMPPEAGFTEAAHALATGPWTLQLARRRSLVKVVDVIHRVVQDRLATDDLRAKPVLFVMNGLGRARDFEVNATGDAIPDDLDMLHTIETILRDGPEVGVHTIAWADSLTALNRRLPKSSIREFALRVAGPMSKEDSLAFIDSESASSLEQNEALFADEDWGKLHKLRPYAPPSVDWLEKLAELATHAN